MAHQQQQQGQQQEQQQQYQQSIQQQQQQLQQQLQQQQPYPHQFIPSPHPSSYQTLPFPYSHHQYHHNPQYHHQYPIQSQPQPNYPPAHNYPPHPGRPNSKRPRESFSDFEQPLPSNKRQAIIGNDVLFRVVVPSSQIGKVIGKAGHRVQKVRDDTKSTIKIADPIARYEERVIIISSKVNDGAITDAEKALLQISSLILADDGSTASSQTFSVGAAADPYGGAAAIAAAAGVIAGHTPTNSVKLLIAGSQAGGLIGVSGQNIEKIRNSSGATIAVLAPNQLPLCASAHDSDRLVQISGEVSSVLKAVEEIGVELRANPPSEVISISPTYNLSIARAAQSYMDPNAAEYVTLDMVISETMVGGLIGRSGSNIARIRSESGAMMKVIGGKGEQKHRQIQLIGTAQQVALAKQRVDEYIYSQLTQ